MLLTRTVSTLQLHPRISGIIFKKPQRDPTYGGPILSDQWDLRLREASRSLHLIMGPPSMGPLEGTLKIHVDVP